ncbi:2-hydroxyacyl-CoA dehydratase subunit D [Desulfothermobacter acidiphilus]|uniref:2-hydroxyacyl-CoA dehydratase subunit D n=1 Tax=Desulfothermobacter acidiphilus TaxID=1938353 RepID=UPI003F8CAFD2
MATVSWICSYTPRELIRALGLEERRLWGVDARESASPYLAANLCGYSRACLAQVLEERPEAVLVVSSCHALGHLYAALRLLRDTKPFYLSLPRCSSPAAESFLASSLRRLAQELSLLSSASLDEARLSEELERGMEERRSRAHLYEQSLSAYQRYRRLRGEGGELAPASRGPRLLLTGSPPPPALLRLMEDCGAGPVIDDTCGGYRELDLPEFPPAPDPFLSLARLYLRRPPCPCLVGERECRLAYLQGLSQRFGVRGVVYHTVKFCDPAIYELVAVRDWAERSKLPFLWVETEYGEPGEQLRVRLRALVEMLQAEEDG